jgi:hypothetical protein
MNNLSQSEVAVVLTYLATLQQLETIVPTASDNLDTESASGWTHNGHEVTDRLHLLDAWRRRLCAFFGVPPGEGLQNAGLTWVI